MSREAAPSAGTGKAGGARKLGRWLTRWWIRAPDGRVYQRRWADVLVAAAGLGVVIMCGVLVANQLVAGTDVALFHRVNHWPGWLYPPDVGSPVVGSDRGASPAGCRSRAPEEIPPGRCPGGGDAAEDMAGGRGQDVCAASPARGDSAGRDLARQLRCSWAELSLRSRHGDLRGHRSGDPLPERLVEVLPWTLAAAVCLSRSYLGAHFPLDIIAGAGLGMFIGGVLNLVFGVPGISPALPAPTGPVSSTRSRRGAAEVLPPGFPRSRTPGQDSPVTTAPQGNRPRRASRRDDVRAASNNAHSRMICAR